MQKQKNKEKIEKSWLVVLETLLALRNIISDAAINFKELPECLILAQKLNNQFDFFEREFIIPNEVVSVADFKSRKGERDVEYKRLYKIFDELRKEEIIKYITLSLKDRIKQYELMVASLATDRKKDIIKMLEIRDEIKFLLDELEIWLDKWGIDKEREEWKNKNKLWQEVAGYDKIWIDFAKEYRDKLNYLDEERINHLIMKPDGSARFDFSWWFV